MPVAYHGNRVGFDAVMPRSTRRRHESPKYGDAQSAIARARGGCLDINLQTVLVDLGDGRRRHMPVTGHWGRLGSDGWTHTTLGRQRGLRRLTRAEKRLTYQQWVNRHGRGLRALQSLRKPGRRGSAPTDSCLTWNQAVAHAERVGTVLTPELKSRRFATHSYISEHMVAVCRKHDHPLWAMALLNMWRPQDKCRRMIGAGGQFALIFGRARHLARGSSKIRSWPVQPTRIWGPKSARQWLRA